MNRTSQARSHGILLMDKPKGITSHDLVARVRRLLGTKAVGHAGTLDPLATGLMVLLLGEGTKLSDYLLTANKGYWVKVRLGVQTDSLDVDGEVLSSVEVDLPRNQIEDVVTSAQGTLELPIPMFSAVKQKGQKLYEYARRNESIEVPSRAMKFFQLEVDEIGKDYVCARFHCSKGSFVRSWASHIGEQLAVGGVVEELRRDHSHPYHINQAISWERLEEVVSSKGEQWSEACGESFVSLKECLPHWRALTLGGLEERLMSNGQVPRALGRRLIVEQKLANSEQSPIGVKVVSAATGELLSLLEAQPFKGLKIRRIFKVEELR